MFCGVGIRVRNPGTLVFRPIRRFGTSLVRQEVKKPVVFKRKSKFSKKQEVIDEELKDSKYVEAINSGSWIRKYGAIASTHAFQQKMIKWYILGYGIFLMFGVRFFQKEYMKDQEREELATKLEDNSVEHSEYERLRLKELSRQKLRSTDVLKLQEYAKLREKHDPSKGEFNPGPDEIKQIEFTPTSNEKILPLKDLTQFYDNIAPKYDSEIGMEETLSFIGSKRKWVMNQIKGDVLEVACGTGRNIKYLDLSQINSITFLDTSSKMMEITNEKFRKEFNDFKKVAFVTAKLESLDSISNGVKYDTIIETFGLCSHEDPVKALKNMESLLKPGGRIVLLEHGRGSYDFINNILDNRAHKHSETWGCRWNLDIGELVDQSGLDIVEEKRSHFGTTWCIVAKRSVDPKKKEEVGVLEKYFSKPN